MTDRLLTDDELAAIEAVWKASTPGDWRVEYDEYFLEEDGLSVRWPKYILTEPLPYAMAPGGSELVMDIWDSNCRDEDAEFVVNAHRSVPRLLAHIRAQDAALARLRADLAIIEQGCNSPWMTGAAFKDRVADLFAARRRVLAGDKTDEGE